LTSSADWQTESKPHRKVGLFLQFFYNRARPGGLGGSP
jgi:hypothetical protein